MISHAIHLKKYKTACSKVFKKIAKIIKEDNSNFKKHLKGKVKFAKFKNQYKSDTKLYHI